jgi:hypothetical protein
MCFSHEFNAFKKLINSIKYSCQDLKVFVNVVVIIFQNVFLLENI